MIAAGASAFVFLGMLWLILTEKLHRTVAAIGAAALMVILGLILGFYSEKQALASVDFSTLGLLLGMMTLVALLEPTGFFQFLAVWAGKLSKGHPIRLLILLGTVTTLLSMFLDNVTTAILIAPITVLICEILGLSPAPFLVTEALLSNTGGVATLIGDPPNVLIASAAGFTFNDFLTHTLPVVLFCWLAALGLLIGLFRKDLSIKSVNVQAVMRLNPAESFNDRATARKALVILGITLTFFFLHNALHISPALVALVAAASALVWIRPDIKITLQRVEWDVLMFFIALFIVVGGLEQTGVLHSLVSVLNRVVHISPVLFGILLLWLSAILSAVVDNVPLTIALIPVIQDLGAAGMEIQPLWWALAFGAGFGGNGTIIGSTANIIVAGISERTRAPITARLWSRRGLPVMLGTCLVASIFYVLLYPLFTR